MAFLGFLHILTVNGNRKEKFVLLPLSKQQRNQGRTIAPNVHYVHASCSKLFMLTQSLFNARFLLLDGLPSLLYYWYLLLLVQFSCKSSISKKSRMMMMMMMADQFLLDTLTGAHAIIAV